MKQILQFGERGTMLRIFISFERDGEMVLVERKLNRKDAFIFALAIAACILVLYLLTQNIPLSMIVGMFMGALLGWGGMFFRSVFFAITGRTWHADDAKSDDT